MEDLAEFGKYYLHEGARLRKKVFFELKNGHRTFAYRYIVLMTNIFNNEQFGADEDGTVSVSRIAERDFEFSDGKDRIIVTVPRNIDITTPRLEAAQEISAYGAVSPRHVEMGTVATRPIQSAI